MKISRSGRCRPSAHRRRSRRERRPDQCFSATPGWGGSGSASGEPACPIAAGPAPPRAAVAGHSEAAILDKPKAKGFDPQEITTLYTERQPCGACASELAAALQAAHRSPGRSPASPTSRVRRRSCRPVASSGPAEARLVPWRANSRK
ncbi:nucleic acid/nucleotide deaminase domain-containing protein [Streptomyces sp. NPDC002308]